MARSSRPSSAQGADIKSRWMFDVWDKMIDDFRASHTRIIKRLFLFHLRINRRPVTPVVKHCAQWHFFTAKLNCAGRAAAAL